MKKYLLLIAIILLIPFAHAHAITCGDTVSGTNGYSYAREICIDHNKAGSSDTSNFVLDYDDADSWLATVGNGGKVQNTTTETGGAGITVPADVIFTSDSGCTTKLNWEFETYNTSTGLSRAWVNVGTLSHTTDTHIYECYGKSSVTTWQGNVNGTWDTNYVSVWHMPSNTGTNTTDSTSYANNATVNTGSVGDTTGMIDGGMALSAAGAKYLTMSNVTSYGSAQAFTMEAWIYKTADNGHIYANVIGGTGAITQGADLFISDNGTDKINAFYGGGSNLAVGTQTISLNAWHKVVYTYDGSNHINLYVDGVADSSNPFAVGSWSGGGSNNTRIGSWSPSDGTYFFEGTLDEARISITNRSADQILSEYNNQSATSTFYTIGSEQSGGGGGGSVISRIINLILFGNW